MIIKNLAKQIKDSADNRVMGAVDKIPRGDAVAFDDDGSTEAGEQTTSTSPPSFDPYSADEGALRTEWSRLTRVINGGNPSHETFEQRALVAYRFGDCQAAWDDIYGPDPERSDGAVDLLFSGNFVDLARGFWLLYRWDGV